MIVYNFLFNQCNTKNKLYFYSLVDVAGTRLFLGAV